MSQQFAPSIWIFAAVGIALLIARLPQAHRDSAPPIGAVVALCTVMGIGATALAIGFVRPYEHIEDAQERVIAEQFFEKDPTGMVIFACAGGGASDTPLVLAPFAAV